MHEPSDMFVTGSMRHVRVGRPAGWTFIIALACNYWNRT